MNIGQQLNDWLIFMAKKEGMKFTSRHLALEIGIDPSTISGYKNGKSCGRKNLARIAEGFGVTVDRFLEGPTVEKSKAQDELYDCRAARLKTLVCEGCKVPKRYCAIQCKLERYFRLCYEVVNGMIDMREAEKRAKTMDEDCILDANARHDRETGFEG